MLLCNSIGKRSLVSYCLIREDERYGLPLEPIGYSHIRVNGVAGKLLETHRLSCRFRPVLNDYGTSTIIHEKSSLMVALPH